MIERSSSSSAPESGGSRSALAGLRRRMSASHPGTQLAVVTVRLPWPEDEAPDSDEDLPAALSSAANSSDSR